MTNASIILQNRPQETNLLGQMIAVDQAKKKNALLDMQIDEQDQINEIKSISQGIFELDGYLERGDVGGADAFLQNRIGQIDAKYGNQDRSAHSRNALKMLREGRIQELRAGGAQFIDMARQMGVIQGGGTKLTNFKPLDDGGMAGFNPATNSFERVSSDGLNFKDTSAKTSIEITNEAEAKGMTEEQKALAKSRVKRFEGILDAADNAIAQNEQLEQLKNIDVATGFGVETRAMLAAAVNSVFGEGTGDSLLKVDVNAVQAFKGVSNRMVNSELNKAKGPQTDGDAKRAQSTLASISNEQLANQFLISSLQATNARMEEQAEFYQNVLERDGSLKKADREWLEFKRKTPMLSANVKDPQTGLPMFFNEFKQKAMANNPGATDEQIIKAWRELNE